MSPALASGRVRRALGLEEDGEGRRYTSFVADSREAQPGSLFFALQGASRHGFEFLADAARRGAAGAVVPDDRPTPELELELFPVASPREALLELAADVRRGVDARIVGITGSSGKTTVKEMTTAALEGALEVYATRGNLNSTVGLPLSVLDAPADADVWVLEHGTSRRGEIARLAEVSAPDDAVVTTVGPAHLEGLGDLEGVLQEKLDLVRGASEEGSVVVGDRPSELPAAARSLRPDTVVAGLGRRADLLPERWKVGGDRVVFRLDGLDYRVEAGGEHHLRDALLAVGVARALGVPDAAARDGLARFRPLGHRGALRRVGGLAVLADCYNANPESFAASIRWCVDGFPDRPRAAAVGTMLELGERSAEAHRRVARRLLEAGFDPVAATGAFVEAFEALEAGGARVLAADDAEEAGRRLAGALRGDEAVLVKGSRGARMERAVDALEARFGAGGDGPPADGGEEGAEGTDGPGGGTGDVPEGARGGTAGRGRPGLGTAARRAGGRG